MKYYFKDIENGSIESASVLDFDDVVIENEIKRTIRRSAVHNLVLTIVDHEAEIPDDYTATALMFLAEQNGGELLTQHTSVYSEASQGKPPKESRPTGSSEVYKSKVTKELPTIDTGQEATN
jgi:hypothetical protein